MHGIVLIKVIYMYVDTHTHTHTHTHSHKQILLPLPEILAPIKNNICANSLSLLMESVKNVQCTLSVVHLQIASTHSLSLLLLLVDGVDNVSFDLYHRPLAELSIVDPIIHLCG